MLRCTMDCRDCIVRDECIDSCYDEDEDGFGGDEEYAGEFQDLAGEYLEEEPLDEFRLEQECDLMEVF